MDQVEVLYCIGDIVDNRRKVEAIEVLKNRYYFNINILDYYRVKLLVQNFISKNKCGENFHYARPSLPFHLKILMKSKKGCQDFYDIFVSDIVKKPIPQIKWELLLMILFQIFGK